MPPPTDTRETAPNAPDMYEIPCIEFVVEREAGSPCSRKFVSEQDLVRIGSHPSNDVVITDPQVSRFHCRVTRHARGWRISDTGSLNGTRLCAVPVRDADLIFPECRIELGSSTVRVRETGATSAGSMSKGLTCGALYGQSACMRRLFHTIARIAKTEVAVLIDGETGTGKELVAAEIVQRSGRRDKPL